MALLFGRYLRQESQILLRASIAVPMGEPGLGMESYFVALAVGAYPIDLELETAWHLVA